MSKIFKHIKIAVHRDELPFNNKNLAVIELKNKKISMALFKNKLYAFAYKCPHAGGILTHGFIDELGNIVCPVHRYKFVLKNGFNCSGEGYNIKTWEVEETQDGVFVLIEESSSFWNFFG